MGYTAYDIDDVEGLFTMVDKKTQQPVVNHSNDDLQKVQNIDWICSVDNLKKIIADEKSDIAFYCGNASNLDEIIPSFDLIILLKVDSEVARQRLSTRTSNDFGRTKEVQDWLLSWKDSWEREVEEKGAIVIDANRDLSIVASEVIENTLSNFRGTNN